MVNWDQVNIEQIANNNYNNGAVVGFVAGAICMALLLIGGILIYLNTYYG